MKNKIILILLLTLSNFCSKEKMNYEISETYNGLRSNAFSITPENINLSLNNKNSVYGIIMETGYPDAVVSLISLADGTTSLYFSNGGGMIGIGKHEKPKAKSIFFTNEANNYLPFSQQEKSNKFRLPEKNEVIFYFLTTNGIFSFADLEENLGNEKSKLSKLFFIAHELITEARLVSEKNN